MTKLEEEGYGAKFVVGMDELDLGATPASQEELSAKGSRPKVRIDKLLKEAAKKASTGMLLLYHWVLECRQTV